ncbi:MAG: hypothetical protein ACREGG_04385 [Candidatus Saccharimonadales bacterium]
MVPVIFYCLVISGNPDNDNLSLFDPATEWLVSRCEYLTWREWGEYTPERSAPVAVLNKNGKFMVDDHAWSGRFPWMSHVAIQRGQGVITSSWEPSEFQGLYGLPKDLEDIRRKLDLINAFHGYESQAVEVQVDSFIDKRLRLEIAQPGTIKRLVGVRSDMSPKEVWWSIRNQLIDHRLLKQDEVSFH